MEEYKKRITEMVEKIEKSEEILEKYQQILGKMINFNQSVILRNTPLRSDQRIFAFMILIEEYYILLEDPIFLNKDIFQEDIDFLYDLIYLELKKESPFVVNNKYRFTKTQKEIFEGRNRYKMINYMKKLLGEENVKQFYKKYNISDLLGKKFFFFQKNVDDFIPTPASLKTIVFLIIFTIFTIIILILILNY